MLSQKLALAAAGNAAGDPVYVDDVFSTFAYTATQPLAQTITNGIDLSGEGGLVWLKSRDSNNGWRMVDTERGATKALESYDSTAEATESTGLTAFTSTGFSVGTANHYNGPAPNDPMISYTFRKCPGFFDVVTWTGNGTSGRTISHNLGSVPGSIWVKRLSASENWWVYHRSVGNTRYLYLNSNITGYTGSEAWNNTTPTASVFTVGNDTAVNANGETYVAYIFAHDDQSFGDNGNEAIIKCGSYVGTGVSGFPGNKITLGFEPQWLLIKAIDNSGTNWEILDSIRGMHDDLSNGSPYLRANLSNVEFRSDTRAVFLHADGFSVQGNNTSINGLSGDNFLYIAIRRPHKPPTAGTDVFAVNQVANDSVLVNVGFPVDFGWQKTINDTWNNFEFNRLRGPGKLQKLDGTDAEYSFGPGPDFGSSTHMQGTRGIGANVQLLFGFKRAPGFFDLVAYNGTGSATTQNHNLKAVPELMIIKRRDSATSWIVYSEDIGASPAVSYNLYLNNTNDKGGLGFFNNTAPTSSVFSVGTSSDVNDASGSYFAYLFASLPGISKVGSYTGTGYDLNIDCGFTSGARFVYIKRADAYGDWYVWNSTSGIVSGNDPYILTNSTAHQVTNTDYIDPLNAGFTVTSSAPAALNVSGGHYIFLAIS